MNMKKTMSGLVRFSNGQIKNLENWRIIRILYHMKLDKEIRMKLWPYYIKEKPNMSFDNYFKINKDKVYLSSFNRKLIWIKK